MFKQALMCGVLCGAIGCSADDVKERAVVTATLGRLDPMFAAYVRVDGSEWSVVSDSDFNAGVVSFGVQFDRYLTVAVRCSGEHTPTYVIERSIARGDSPTLNFPCKTLPATRHRVTGQLASAGIVGLGTAIVDSVDVFELEVPAGTYDLVASTELSLYYQPDLVVTDDLALPEIDVDAQGAPLSRFAVRVPDELDGWRASTRTRLRTPNGTAFALGGENGPDVIVPSPEVRDQGVEVDSYVEVSRSSNGVQQSIRAPVSDTGDVTFFAPLPFEILPTSLDAVEVSFADLPRGDDYVLMLTEDGSGSSSVATGQVIATDRWRDASEEAALRFDPPAELAFALNRISVSARVRFVHQPDDVLDSVAVQGAENAHSFVSTSLVR